MKQNSTRGKRKWEVDIVPNGLAKMDYVDGIMRQNVRTRACHSPRVNMTRYMLLPDKREGTFHSQERGVFDKNLGACIYML